MRELQKISANNLKILDKNPVKASAYPFSPSVSPTGRFPFQRKSRSNSPPKDNLAIYERGPTFFFPGSPVMAENSLQSSLRTTEVNEEDNDLKLLKEQYLKMIQQAPSLNFKSELFENEDELSGTEEFDEWETTIMKKMQLH
jgi:hypothetical protein